MNIAKRLFLLTLLLLSCCVPAWCAAQEGADFAAQVQPDFSSETLKQEVSVKTFIDGDTTHFFVPESVSETGVLKARYLAVNTPETTGKIEEYGKKAAAFTREKLTNAVSILIESDDATWNLDSTGDRHLVWVWYKTAEGDAYRNLNIELLQNGLAIANSSAQNRYGDVCMAAIAQARDQKLHVYSGQKDPDFYYGDAVELTLKELRCHPEEYSGVKVAFEGVITMNNANSVFIEDYDEETGLYYGISVYYGYGLSGMGLDILSVGNRARIVGTMQYYEAGGTYQVSGLTYRMMKPNDPGNIQKISDGHAPAYVLTDAQTFANGHVLIQDETAQTQYDYAALALATSIEMQNLTVTDAYTTLDEDSSSNGAITLSCVSETGEPITVRTIPLYDENHQLITQDAYLGRTISVRGIVDFYDGAYQIKVFTATSITIH